MAILRSGLDFFNKILYIYLGVLFFGIFSYVRIVIGNTEFDYWYSKIFIIAFIVLGIIFIFLKIETTRKYLNDYIGEIQLGLVIALTVMGIYNESFKTDIGISVFLIVLIFTVFIIAYSGLSHKRYSDLEHTIEKHEEAISQLEDHLKDDELRKREEVKHYIRNLAENRLGFCQQEKYNDRISLYLHLDKPNVFMLYYRFSKNPELQKTGRRTYPDDMGAIRDAWLHGKTSRLYENRYEKDPDAYVLEVHEKDGLPKDLIPNLTMKPHQLIACRLDKGQDIYYGLLVIESNREELLKPADVYQIVNTCGHSKGELHEKIGDLRTLFPDMMESSKEMGLENDS